jgi:heme oxygenase
MTEIMARLRDETADLHHQAETREFQQRMFRGELGRPEYVAWLAQMWHVHRTLESELVRARTADARFVAVRDEHFKAERLAADLDALGAGRPAPLGSTARLLARIEAAGRDEPLRLLGYLYVLEGSANGNRILARRMLPTLGLDAATAGRYLDPYGDRQREVWVEFKSDMARFEISPAQGDALVGAARELFAGISELSSELNAPAHRPTAAV